MKVFISHSNLDSLLINEFIKALERLGCKIFYSSKAHMNSIRFGENFYETIKTEIKDSDYILAMLSDNFYRSIPCQVEMGIAYAFDKNIKTIGIQNKNYKELLRGIFTTNDRLATFFKEEDIIGILSLFSNETLKVINYAKDIILKSNSDMEISCDVIDKDKVVTSTTLKEDYVKELIITGQLNINECIFLKYMLDKRRYKFEWAWQREKGTKKFGEWAESDFTYVEGDLTEVYVDIINHFIDLELLDETEMTSEGNVRLFGFKPEYAKQLISFYNKNPKIIENECEKQSSIPF
ncbi:toll/interleukin-1 receptor domain-containing protein [Clostridium frigoris]|uniref:Toll/interleukin-1 receptor domain-containing protein n=1 Tax=Clostridium frigoris TaxID=205327 RepID=A0ABS6BT11_9CLOT|nr:toll/interleukin-1 receptor domain-containing protein [Clostridium frigoris]MBU3159509.1 toll/interleukin-1 receptor domain-containing protein [Clostridium frigoris]